MKREAVIGAGFGDEGKGKVVNALCLRYPGSVVARFSGGHNASHRVVMEDGREHIFSSFGSGALAGCPTYLMKDVIVSPVALLNELDDLCKKDANTQIFIDPLCRIATPYDAIANKNSTKQNEDGTCGVGIYNTFMRHKNGFRLTFKDLYSKKEILRGKINKIANFYGSHRLYSLDFLESCQELANMPNVHMKTLTTEHESIIFEGSQGLMLDQNHGFFPHVTPANTGAENILKAGFRPHINLVTRSFCSRHGNGPMPQMHSYRFKIEHEHNNENCYQGEFRRTLLDTGWLRSFVKREQYIYNSDKTVFINHIDAMQEGYKTQYQSLVQQHHDEFYFCKEIAKYLNCKKAMSSYQPESIFMDMK